MCRTRGDGPWTGLHWTALDGPFDPGRHSPVAWLLTWPAMPYTVYRRPYAQRGALTSAEFSATVPRPPSRTMPSRFGEYGTACLGYQPRGQPKQVGAAGILSSSPKAVRVRELGGTRKGNAVHPMSQPLAPDRLGEEEETGARGWQRW